MVTKSDGSKRVVVDFANLNRHLVPVHTVMPSLREAHDRLCQGMFRSMSDLWLCFHQFGMSPESVPLTATWFSRDLLLSFVIAPMGISSVPPNVQTRLARDFNNDYTMMYIDDCLQVLKTAARVVVGYEHMLSTCEKYGWTLKAKK